MKAYIYKHPAQSLLVLSLCLSGLFIAPVVAGVAPVEFSQLSALGPSLAAIILVLVSAGRTELRGLLSRGLVWRVGLKWWLFVLISPAFLAVASLTLFNLFGGPTVDYSTLEPLVSIVPMIVVLTIAAGVGEEFGWRGFLLPRLQSRDNALYASCIVGLVWGLWHIPLFFVDGTVQSQWAGDIGVLLSIILYVAFLIANAIQFTWVFNNTKGSVLMAALLHGSQNAWIGGYIDVYRGEIGGIIAFTVVSWIVAGVLILVAGSEHVSLDSSRQTIEL